MIILLHFLLRSEVTAGDPTIKCLVISASISPSFDILRNIQNDPRPTTVSHVHVHPPAGGASTSRGLQKSPGNVLVFSVLFSNGKFSGRARGRRK